MNRTKLLLKNIFAGVGSKIISLLLGFASRTVFIMYLGNVYLGINGLFVNILQILSFAELGFGTALNFAMYKPIANNDEQLIVQLLNYYKKIYKIIAIVILIIGSCLIPAIPYLTKGAEGVTNKELMIFYSVSLFNTVITYFVSYKLTYVNACQKGYIVTTFDMLVNSLIIIAQIITIICSKNYLINLIVQSVLLLLSRIGISFYLNKKFPIVKTKTNVKLNDECKKSITSNVKGLVVHQFASIAIHATDNIIISSIINVVIVGLVSNYNLLISSIVGFLTIIFNSFYATFGNIYATETKDLYFNHFKMVNFINFWLYGFCSIAFFILIPPFITLWIGSENLIDNYSFILIVINQYLLGQCTLYNSARSAVGNFNIDKWWAFAQAIVNLIVSIIGAYYLGLVGVYIGTIVSRIVYMLLVPLSTYRLMFDKKVNSYYYRMVFYFLITLITGIICYFSTQFVLSIVHWGWFVLGCIIVFILSNLLFLLATFWTKDFKSTKDYLLAKLKRRKENV